MKSGCPLPVDRRSARGCLIEERGPMVGIGKFRIGALSLAAAALKHVSGRESPHPT